MMSRLTRRRQVKKRSKHSRKYNKTRRGKYIKKRRSVTRRRVLRGGDQQHSAYSNHIIEVIVTAIKNSSPERFRLLVDGLEIDPTILRDPHLQTAYKKMIELLNINGAPTGFIGLAGLKFLNYLWSRVKLLDPTTIKYRNLQTAISLMDQFALAHGVVTEQLPTIKKLAPNSYYYNCYYKLFNDLSTMMNVGSRNIPVSSSACHMNDECGTGNDSCDSDGGCCSPTGLPTS